MASRRGKRTVCKRCGGHVRDVGQLSARGKCMRCGHGNMLRNAAQLKAHSGPFFEHWRERGAASYGARLMDAPPDSE